jgi:GT2 family glycosyltransferase
MRTTVVMMSTDEAALLRVSLPAAQAQEGAEVVVVDNGSADDTAAVAREHGAEVWRLDPRRSYVDATNEALLRAEGDAVMLLNSDCFLAPGFLAAARPRLEEERVGSVAPKLIRALGPGEGERLDALDGAGMVIDRRRKNTLVGHGRPALAYDRPAEVFGVDGAAALYRRETIEDCLVGGLPLDPAFERWASDVDLAWRARLLGWRCVYEPAAVAWHVRYYSPSTRATMPAYDRRMQFRNRYLMMLKNDTVAAVARDLPRLAAYEAGQLGYALLAERSLLPAYRDAARLARGALRQRRELQARRRERGAPPAPLGLEAPAA